MRALILIISLVSVGGFAQAQPGQRPSLAGHWVQDSQPIPMKGPVPICGGGCMITQTTDTLVVTDGMHENTYKFDGVPAVAIAKTDTITATITKTTSWERATLVIVSTVKSDDLNSGKASTTIARLSVRDGRLTIEGTRANQDGTESKYQVTYRLSK